MKGVESLVLGEILEMLWVVFNWTMGCPQPVIYMLEWDHILHCCSSVLHL